MNKFFKKVTIPFLCVTMCVFADGTSAEAKIDPSGTVIEGEKFDISPVSPISPISPASPVLPLTSAASAVWTGTASSDWFTASNWSGGAVPTSAANAYLQNGATVTAYMTTSNQLNAQSIHLETGSLLTVTSVGGQYNLAKQTLMSVEGGTLFWNNESRIVSEITSTSTESYRQTSGIMRATGAFGSINGGTANISGGIFTQSRSDGEIILGLGQTTRMNLGGTALMDVSNLCIGGRSSTAAMNVSGGTLLVRALGTGWCRGMTVGGGDDWGIGTLNITGGKINILSNGNLYVGSDSYSTVRRGVNGTLALSGGELNVANSILVGNVNASTSNNIGVLTLSGSGVLRAGTITPGTAATTTMNFNGGTLVVGTYNGNFTNNGSVIAPETWEEALNTTPTTYTIGSETFNAADEYNYKQTSTYGSTTFSGTYAQTAGTIQLEYGSETQHDSITASSFNITGGHFSLDYSGVVTKTSGSVTLSGLLNATDASAANAFSFDSMNITDSAGNHLVGSFASNGSLTLNYGTITWTGGAGTSDFFTAGNWDLNMVSPSGNQYAVVIENGNVSVNLANGNKIYGSNIRIGSGGTLSVSNNTSNATQYGAKSFTVDGGTFNWTSDARVIYYETTRSAVVFEQTSGTSNLNGSWISFNGGTLNISGGSFLHGYSGNSSVLNVGLDQSAVMNVSGTAFVSARNIIVGSRNYNASQPAELNISSGTVLVRAEDSQGNYGRGLILGYGDQAGYGVLNLTGGTLNTLAGANVEVGSCVTLGYNAKGALNISGGVMNTAGTMTVGDTRNNSQTLVGSVSMSGGTLRAAKIQLGATDATASWTGGTLSVGNYTGADFVNNGAAIAPETWTFASGTAKTVTEKYYSQTSVFGTSTFSGAFIQNSGSVNIDLGRNNDGTALSDVLSAASFTFSGGSVNVSYSGSNTISGGDLVTYTVFQSTGTGAVNTWLTSLHFDASVTDHYYAKYDSSTGKITLSAADSLIWTGGTGSWNTASGWNQNIVPTTAYNAYILSGTVTNVNSTNAKTLTVGGSGTLNVTSDITLNLSKFSVENGGTVNWNPGSRIVPSDNLSVAASADYAFEMTGGKMTVTNAYTTFSSGKMRFAGGLFRQINTAGTLILGLVGNAVSNIEGDAQIDVVNVSVGGRYNDEYTTKNSVVNLRGNSTTLIRANSTWTNITEGAVGLVIGSGDNNGKGTVNVSENSTINILSAGKVYVGAATRSVNAIGALNIDGGTLNAAGTMYVGKFASNSNTQLGTLSVSDGILRAGVISVGTGSTTEFTGGRLVVGTFNGDFTNAGATLAPETWSFVQDASNANTALEYVYHQDSVFGTSTFNGDYLQNNGAASIEINLSETASDVIFANNFDVSDGVLSLIYGGEYDGTVKEYSIFRTNENNGIMSLNFSNVNLTGLTDVDYYFNSAAGVFVLGASQNSVPEPASWILLIVGLFSMNFAQNARRLKAAV